MRVDKLRLEIIDVQDNLSVAAVKSEAPKSSASVIFFGGATTKRIRTGRPSDDENAVSVGRGDEATIFVSA